LPLVADAFGTGSTNGRDDSFSSRRMNRDEIVTEHLAPLFRFAWALTGEERAAVELTHRVFAEDSWHRHTASGSHATEVALFTAAYRLFARGEPMAIPPVHERIAVLDEQSLQYARDLTADSLLKSFRELELPQRAALVLFHTTHCSLHDIAVVMHRPDDEIVAVIARGKAEWLHILQRDGGSGGELTKGGNA